MTREEAIKYPIQPIVSDTDIGKEKQKELDAYNMAIKALEQEPCEDAISRQAALDYLKANVDDFPDYHEAIEAVLQMPSVNPQEPKTGHWGYVQYDYNPKLGNWHCSECRCVAVECVNKEEKGGIPLYKYCPQCGAKMQEVNR